MKIISQYLQATILKSICFTLATLLGIQIFLNFILEIPNINVGHYDISKAISFVLLDISYQFYILFPIACLIGSLLGLGSLSNQNELIAIRGAGYSSIQIIFALLKVALIIMLIGFIIGEIIAPYTENRAIHMREVAKYGEQAFAEENEVWVREKNKYIYMEKVSSRNHMKNIQIFDFDNNKKIYLIIAAKKAIYQRYFWILEEVTESFFNENKMIVKHLPFLKINLKIDPAALNLSYKERNRMKLHHLFSYIKYLKRNNLQSNSYQINFWQRIFRPFTVAIMIILAIPFIIGSVRFVPIGLRIVIGLTVGYFFYVTNQISGYIALIFQLPPILGAIFPLFCFFLVAMILFSRAK